MLRLTLIVVFAFCFCCPVARSADPGTTNPSPRRTASDIFKDWQVVSQKLRGLLPAPLAMADPERRVEVAPAAILLLRQAISLNGELYHTSPDAQPAARRNHYQYLSILALLDDKAAIAELDEARQSNVRDISNQARQAWFVSRWWKSNGDDTVAAGLLDELEQLARQAPADDSIAATLLSFQQEGSATPEQNLRITQIITKHLTGPLASAAIEQFKSAAKRASLVGKPLLISGTTLEGKAFSTQSLKGKAILVHFGATWCGPWQVQHNLMLQTQWPSDVAVVTILCDEEEGPLRQYWEQHRTPAWPVLWSKEDPTGFAAQYGVEQLPTTILIDSSGKVLATDIDPDEATVKALIAGNPQSR